jgi:tetratricopeptide (TPR) repeat protein
MDDLINKIIAKEKEIKIINPNQLSQIIMFIKLLKTSESGTTASEDQYISKLFENLKITIPLFKIEKFRNFNYNHLELRILLLISLYYKKIEEYEIVLELLHFIIEEMKNKECLTREGKKVLIKTYCNLSYTYYSIEKFKESKNFAELGIKLAVDNDTNCSLHLLYARRAVAKILLNRDDYLQDINNSISILDIRGMNELKKKYINIYTEKYNIDFGSISRD